MVGEAYGGRAGGEATSSRNYIQKGQRVRVFWMAVTIRELRKVASLPYIIKELFLDANITQKNEDAKLDDTFFSFSIGSSLYEFVPIS